MSEKQQEISKSQVKNSYEQKYLVYLCNEGS